MMKPIFLRRRRPVEPPRLTRPARLWIAAALLLGSAEARAERDVPCRGCVLELPPGAAEPLPLLVVLHGDEGSPSVVALPRWSKTAQARGYALLALRCPRDQGCKDGSWWRWGGDPAWIERQVQEVGRRVRLDPRRTFISGWSGGASYLGLVAPQLRGFAGINLNGGGLPPRDEGCPACQPPVYFLVGNGNPLHHLAVASRDAFTRCGSTVEWSLLSGKDHGGELSALDTRRTGQILSWLEQHAACPSPAAASSSPAPSARPPAPSALPPAPSSSSPSLAASWSGAPPSSGALAPAAPGASPGAPAARPPGACGCEAAGGGAGPWGGGAAVAAGLVAALRAVGRRGVVPRRGHPGDHREP